MADLTQLYEKSAKNLFAIFKNELREVRNEETGFTDYAFFEDIFFEQSVNSAFIYIKVKLRLVSHKNPVGFFRMHVPYNNLKEFELNLKYLFETFEKRFPVAMKFDV